MMDHDYIPENMTLTCIHCCGPLCPSNDNNENNRRFHHSSPLSSSSSTYSVSEALSSIFKLNFLEAFDGVECLQKEERLCIKCNDVLADLYHLYQDFLQLGRIESILNKKLEQLDEIIDCHEQKSIHCDLITAIKYEEAHDHNSLLSSPMCSSYDQVKKTTRSSARLREIEIISTTTTTTTTTAGEAERDDPSGFEEEEMLFDDDSLLTNDDDDICVPELKSESENEEEIQLPPPIVAKSPKATVKRENDKVLEKSLETSNRKNRRKQDLSFLSKTFSKTGSNPQSKTGYEKRTHDEIIDCHEQKSINCDLIKTTTLEVHQAQPASGDSLISNPSSSSFANRQLYPKEINKPLTRQQSKLASGTTATTTTTTTATSDDEDEEFNDSGSEAENDEDEDYAPDWLDMKVEEDEFECQGIKVRALQDLIETDDDEKPLLEDVAPENHGTKRRKLDAGYASSTVKSTTRTCRHYYKNRKKLLEEKSLEQYLTLKGKFPNPCWYCEQKDFATPTDCFEHTMQKHFPKVNNPNSKSPTPVCTRCSKICSTQTRFDEHLELCETIPSGVVSKQYKCTVCSKSFSRNVYLQRHMSRHSDDRPYACDQCNYKSKTKRTLSIHKITMHTRSEKVQCEECEKFFKNESALKSHQKIMHTVEGYKQYKERSKIAMARKKEKAKARVTLPMSTVCGDCDVDFFHRLAFRNHRRTVHGDVFGEFICETCGKSMPHKNALQHIKTVHSDTRPYICETCGKSFKTNYALKYHVDRTHTEEGRLRYNEVQRRKNQRRKLVASQLARKAGGGQLDQIDGESSSSNQ